MYQHPKAPICGHRLDLYQQPRHRNCESCWFLWFNSHGENVQLLDEMYMNGGEALIIQVHGKKFYHMWRKFMATIAYLEQKEKEK